MKKGQACTRGGRGAASGLRRCRPETRKGGRAVATECDSLSRRLGTPTIFVRYTVRNPAMPHAAPTFTAPTDPAAFLSAPTANRPPQGAPTPGPTVPFKPSRTDPLNREPAADPSSTAPFKPFSTDPLNREPAAKPGSTAPRVTSSNASSAAATALPACADDPAPRPGQSATWGGFPRRDMRHRKPAPSAGPGGTNRMSPCCC